MNFKYGFRAALTISLTLMTLSATKIFAADRLNLSLTYDGRVHNYSAEPITLVVNNKVVQCQEMPPVILQDSTMVPAREVFEELGATVDWKSETSEVYIGYGQSLAVLKIDADWANVDGTNIYLSPQAKIINGKTMIPMRFGAESLGLKVDWDSASRTAFVSNPDAAPVKIAQDVTTDDTQVPPGIPTLSNTPATPPAETEPDRTITSYILQQLNTHFNDNDLQIAEPEAMPTPESTYSSDVVAKAKDVSTADIKFESHPLTKITDVILPGPDSNTYKITASSAISGVNKTLLEDNRIVLDFVNADVSTVKPEYVVTGRAVSKIRTGLFEREPEMITRVVFDLNTPAEYSVKLSDDRKTLSVEFGKNGITDVRFKTEGENDYIYIDFKQSPNVSLTPLIDPERLIIEAPYSDISKIVSQPQTGKFVTHMETLTKDNFNAQIILSLNKQIQYSVDTSGNQVIIKLFEPTYKNIFYDPSTHTIRIKKQGVNSSLFTESDNYLGLEYTLDLGGDYLSQLGYGEYVVRDNHIDTIVIRNNAAGNTELFITEKQILAYMVSEDDSFIRIKAVNPKEKYPFVLVLDAGHGGKDVGANYYGIYEKNLNLDIVTRLTRLLENDPSFKVYLTRTGDTYPTLEDRVVMANHLADLFISVHNNSAGSKTSVKGTEVYYHTHTNDGTIGISTKQVADIMIRNITGGIGSIDRGTREENYYVVRYTKMPSALVEIGFMTNPDEAANLNNPDYRQKTAEALYMGMLEIRSLYSPRG